MGYTYALSWKLLIVGLLLEYFVTILKRPHLRKIAANVPYFFTDCTFSYEKVKDIFFLFWDKDQIYPGEGKRKGEEGGMGERAKMRYFFLKKNPIIKQDTNYLTNLWSGKLLTTTIGISTPQNL